MFFNYLNFKWPSPPGATGLAVMTSSLRDCGSGTLETQSSSTTGTATNPPEPLTCLTACGVGRTGHGMT